MNSRRVGIFIAINIIISATVTLLVLSSWESRRSAVAPALAAEIPFIPPPQATPLGTDTALIEAIEPSAPPITPAPTVPSATAIPPTPTVSSTPTIAPSPTAPSAPFAYVIEAGDTLSGLSLEFDVPLSDLLAVNNLTEAAILSVGQQIIIPIGGAAPDLFAPFTIEGLRARTYDAGPIEIVETLQVTEVFTRYRVAYPGDGLRLSAMLNVPKGSGAPGEMFPVIILNHGYVDPKQFPTGSYIRAEADYLARRGYLTLSPDYRGHADSEGNGEDAGPGVRGMNTFRVGYAVDVLSLLNAIPSLPQADPSRIGMWGHSMGGGITLEILIVDRGAKVKAAVLYGAMSGDEAANLRHIDKLWRPGIFDRVAAVFGTPEDRPDDYARISALTYVGDIAIPVSIHHGTLDDQVPLAWSQDLAQRLQEAAKPVEYFEYEGSGHSLRDAAWNTFMERVTIFLDQNVKGANN